MATTGITAALRPGPISITVKIIQKASGIDTTIQRKIRRFIRERELADPPDLVDFNYDEVVGWLPNAQLEAHQVENVSNFYDPQLAVEYAEALGAALGYVQAHAPIDIAPALVGTKTMPPGGLDESEFRRRYLAIDRPLDVLDDLCAGIVVPDQVEALEAVYPQLYASMRLAVEQAMIDSGKPLSYEKDQALMVFLQTDIVDPRIHDELSKAFEAARQRESGQTSSGQPAPQPQQKPGGIGDVATQQERLEAK